MRTIIVYGNCQAGGIIWFLRQQPFLLERYELALHPIMINEHEVAQRVDELQRCAVCMVQDIGEWQTDCYKSNLADDATVIFFPYIYLLTLWPTDAYVRVDEYALKWRAAHGEDFFVFHDYYLGELRDIHPDHDERFRAFESYDPIMEGIDRSLEIEAYRLLSSDKKLGISLGQKVMDNFKDCRLFHTITHPANQLLEWLAEDLLARAGIMIEENLQCTTNELFGGYQTPIHPRIIDHFSLKWVAEDSLNEVNFQMLTFEQYYRKYIDYYG